MDYTGLAFPKKKKSRKRKKHGQSIVHQKNGTCYLCNLSGSERRWPVLHKHHIFSGAANRTISEEYGLYCWLCPEHHEWGRDAVHQNAGSMKLLRKIAEEKFEETYSEEEFYQLFGRFYK